jgi:hypothetical protein
LAQEEPRPSRVVPVMIAALVCDTAATDPTTGKKTLIGIFDRLWASNFPTGRPATLYWKITDAEGDYTVEARFVQLKKNELIAKGGGKVSVPDRMSAFDYYLFLPMLIFPEPGRYEVQVLMNDAYLGGVIIDAQEAKGIAE